MRDPRAPSPRTLDTGLLFCEGHGKLLAPPHVEEFLSGERRALLGGLDPDRSGCVCEVLTPQEWDALTLVRGTSNVEVSHPPRDQRQNHPKWYIETLQELDMRNSVRWRVYI